MLSASLLQEQSRIFLPLESTSISVELYISLILRVCISDVREEGGLATLEELREKFGKDKVGRAQIF